jgi:[acyl-carrier-protein] S-malonyltransferase
MAWAALFPGQGSQAPGMGKFLYEQFPVAKRCFEEASDTLNLDFKKLCFEGSEAELALTENTQPCLLLVSTATYRVLNEELGFVPRAAAGHSIGEYAAVVAAGALPFAQGILAVRKRGQAMQSAVPVGEGGMTAVMGLDADQVAQLCQWAEKETKSGPIQAANINAPGQIVISGRKSVLDWAAANFKPEVIPGSARVKFIPLKVSAPFHCAMMKPAEDVMQDVLSGMNFNDAEFPIVQNVSAEAVREGDQLRTNLVKQVSAPVRWIECIQRLISLEINRAVEAGCGKVLNGLVKKIDSERLTTFNVNSLEDIKALEAQLKGEA